MLEIPYYALVVVDKYFVILKCELEKTESKRGIRLRSL